MMKYVVKSFYDNARVTVETDDPEVAVFEMSSRDMDGIYALCLSGETGEILAIVNEPNGENYNTPEFALMMLGTLMANTWGDEPTCGECGGPVNENSACQHCGVEDDTLTADPAVAFMSALFGIPADEVVAIHNGKGLLS